jgi:hypothetical protein
LRIRHFETAVIPDDADWSKWLGEDPTTESTLLAMLAPCPYEALKIWAVHRAVCNVKNKGPQLIIRPGGRVVAPGKFIWNSNELSDQRAIPYS